MALKTLKTCPLKNSEMMSVGTSYLEVQLMKMYKMPFAIKYPSTFYIMCNNHSEPNHDYMSGKAITR